MRVAIAANPQHAFLLRPAQPADLEALIALRLEALRTNPTAFGGDYEHSLKQPPGYWLSRFLPEPNAGQVVVTEADDGQLLGTAGISRQMGPKTLHSASIWGIYVLPEFRGQRITGAMLEACFAWGRTHGVLIVKLGVVTDNLPAIRSYQRAGFSIYGTEPQAIFYDGRYYDEFLMCKSLR